MSLNKVMLIGNVGQVPEVKETDGRSWCKLTLATTDRAYTTKYGAQIPERTEWHNLVFNGKLAEIAGQYVNKGMKLYVEGKLRTRMYQKDGTDRYITEVMVEKMEMLSPRQGDQPQVQSSLF